jgi:hypothetical protein
MLFAVALFLLQSTAELSGAKHSETPPAPLAPAVSAQLSPGGVRVTVGANALTFWFVKQLTTSPDASVGKPGAVASWSEVREGTLVGAVTIDKDFRDIRGRVVKAGTFTVRYGIQPANGDHLGVSPYREFLLLSPAAIDTDPAPRAYDALVEVSKEAIGGSHPAVLSLDPPVSTAAPLALSTTELGHRAITLEVPTAGGALRFGLVLIGKIEA